MLHDLSNEKKRVYLLFGINLIIIQKNNFSLLFHKNPANEIVGVTGWPLNLEKTWNFIFVSQNVGKNLKAVNFKVN